MAILELLTDTLSFQKLAKAKKTTKMSRSRAGYSACARVGSERAAEQKVPGHTSVPGNTCEEWKRA